MNLSFELRDCIFYILFSNKSYPAFSLNSHALVANEANWTVPRLFKADVTSITAIGRYTKAKRVVWLMDISTGVCGASLETRRISIRRGYTFAWWAHPVISSLVLATTKTAMSSWDAMPVQIRKAIKKFLTFLKKKTYVKSRGRRNIFWYNWDHT